MEPWNRRALPFQGCFRVGHGMCRLDTPDYSRVYTLVNRSAHRDKRREWKRSKAKVEPLLTQVTVEYRVGLFPSSSPLLLSKQILESP